jgi:Kef-type K+ transport system membrane component KefB
MLNGIVAGAAVAFVADGLGLPLGTAVGVGAAAGLTSIGVSQRWQSRLHLEASREGNVMFSSGRRTTK